MKQLLTTIFILTAAIITAAPPSLEVVGRTSDDSGLLCRLEKKKTIIFLAGSPAEMGTAQGQLLASGIKTMADRVKLVAMGYLIKKKDNFYTRINEVMQRTRPYMPERFYVECDAMSHAAGITTAEGRQLNLFSEMFHCSGVAVRNSATIEGRLIHARVLDYMRDIGLQQDAVLMVFLPTGRYGWVSQSYAGFIGTVTAMNEKGLAIGEIGGRGEGKWDGLPMSFLMRRVMEECATVEEALVLIRSVPLTCAYYYVVSDRKRDMAAIVAQSGTPPVIIRPGEKYKGLPAAPQDTVYISGGVRAKALVERLEKHFGRIDVPTMIEIIKRPVAMKSNLQCAIFLPESGEMYFADAGAQTPACDEPYYRIDLKALIDFYRTATAKPVAVK